MHKRLRGRNSELRSGGTFSLPPLRLAPGRKRSTQPLVNSTSALAKSFSLVVFIYPHSLGKHPFLLDLRRGDVSRGGSSSGSFVLLP